VAERFTDRRGLVLVAAAERYAPKEQFGLGVWLAVNGPTLVRAGLLRRDDSADPVSSLARWCEEQTIPTELSTVSEFFEWKIGRFRHHIYTGRGLLVSADLGRAFGLCCEHWSDTRDKRNEKRDRQWEGAFTFWLPTWSVLTQRDDGRVARQSASPHLPPIRARVAGPHGYFVEFARPPGGPAFGIRDPDGTYYRGRFLDVIPAAFGLDGLDSDCLGDHLMARGLPGVEIPIAVTLDTTGATDLFRAAIAVWKLALSLDREAVPWLTTTEDRKREQIRIDVAHLHSPAGLATAVLRRVGVIPLLVKYDRPSDSALNRWMSAHFGGWQSAEEAGGGARLAADIDEVSAYAQNFGLLGGWEYCAAAELDEEDATDNVRELVARIAAGDLTPLFDQATYRPDSLGCTLCEVICRGDELPIEIDEEGHLEGGYRIRPIFSEVLLARSVYDVMLSGMRTGRLPEIVRATRLIPRGRQSGLRQRLPLYNGLVVDLTHDDPVAALVRLRHDAKSRGDEQLAVLLRVLVNAMSYGNFGRLDQVSRWEKNRWVVRERPAEYTFPPLAASVTALTRLLVGLTEHLVKEATR